MVEILMDDHPLLRTVSEPVTDFNDPLGLPLLVADMIEATEDRRGLGLSAVQIGVPLRVMIVKDGERWIVMVNPSLARTLNRFETKREGCLSIPMHKWGDVARPAKCDAVWFDMDGIEHRATLTGQTARIFQHELDHLNGVLLTDHDFRTKAIRTGRWRVMIGDNLFRDNEPGDPLPGPGVRYGVPASVSSQ